MIRIGQTEPIAIGYQGETLSRLVEFDVSPILTEFGTGGVFAIVNKRKYGDLAYPVPVNNFTLDGSTLKWTITDTELCYNAKGRVQLKYTLNGSVVKTAVFDTIVNASLGSTTTVPAPMQSYIDQLTDLAGDVQTGAQAAATSASNAATSEANALSYKNAVNASAVAASGSAGTAAYWAGKAEEYAGDAQETAEALEEWVEEQRETLRGETGPQGPQGPQGIPGPTGAMGGSGVYVGSGTAPAGYNVQIDTDGDETIFPQPTEKTSDMTQSVGIDSDGKLWTAPGGSSGGGIDYSTSEQDTGLKWIDGKNIYQKTYSIVLTSDMISDGSYMFDDSLACSSLFILKDSYVCNASSMTASAGMAMSMLSRGCSVRIDDYDECYLDLGDNVYANNLVVFTIQYTKP